MNKKAVILLLTCTSLVVWTVSYVFHKAEYDATNEKIDKITKNIVCVEIGSMGYFGYQKGLEGAKECQQALEYRKFYRKDRVRVTRNKNEDLINCKGTVADWSFDPKTMKPTYILSEVTCIGVEHDEITVFEDGLERIK